MPRQLPPGQGILATASAIAVCDVCLAVLPLLFMGFIHINMELEKLVCHKEAEKQRVGSM